MSASAISSVSKSFPELKELDSLLRCGICYEFMKNTLVTACSHNYCSYCIRKFMQYKSQCPTCFKETTEPQLRNNRLIDQLIGLFEKLCEKIEDITYDRGYVTENLLRVKDNSEVNCSVPTPHTTNDSILVDETQANNAEKKILVPDMFTPRRKVKRRIPVETEPIKLVPCPVCAVDIPERNINTHLDKCLSKSKEEPPVAEVMPVDRRKPLPKLVYPLMQEKDLRKKLKEIGLSTLGDKKALINRHQRFIVLYNSECDSLNPLSMAEIVEHVNNEEKFEKKIPSGNTLSMTKTWLTVSKKADSQTIEMAQKEYLKENKNSFSVLVEKIKQQKQQRLTWSEQAPSSSSGCKQEEQSRSLKVAEKRENSPEERSSSPEISQIPVDKPSGVLHSSFDMFESSRGSPCNFSGQNRSPFTPVHPRNVRSPVTPELPMKRLTPVAGTSRTNDFPPPLSSPKTSPVHDTPGPSKRVICPDTPPPSRRVIAPEKSAFMRRVLSPDASEHSSDGSPTLSPFRETSLDGFSKEDEDFCGFSDKQSEKVEPARSPCPSGTVSLPTTPTHSNLSPAVCQFSPNVCVKFQNGDKEGMPSPPFGDKSPSTSPVIHRTKRLALTNPVLLSSDGEDNDVFKEWLERDTLEYENSAIIRRPKRKRRSALQIIPVEGEQRVLRKRTKK